MSSLFTFILGGLVLKLFKVSVVVLLETSLIFDLDLSFLSAGEVLLGLHEILILLFKHLHLLKVPHALAYHLLELLEVQSRASTSFFLEKDVHLGSRQINTNTSESQCELREVDSANIMLCFVKMVKDSPSSRLVASPRFEK